jgi:ketosteroid isomerase-like protein
MDANAQLIKHFYTCFQNKDVQGMQDCYADHAVFNDPVFQNLSAREARSMWAMLIASGKDMRIEFKDIKGDERGASGHWDAYYTFSATGNSVLNKIDATFRIENGKIVEHRDAFNFYIWAKQALGFTGVLLGWTSFLKNKIRKKARKNLENYMNKSSS